MYLRRLGWRSLLPVAAALAAILFVIFNFGYSGTPRAKAVVFDLSGVSDIRVTISPSISNDQFHCMAKTVHNTTTEAVATRAVCFDNTGALSGGGALPGRDLPGEGASNGGTTPQCVYPLGVTTTDAACVGPPPPPPYSPLPPADGTATYDRTNDILVTTTCFPNLGGSDAPNIIAVLHDGDATDIALNGGTPGMAGPNHDLTTMHFDLAAVVLYSKQSNAACTALTPDGGSVPGAALPVAIYPTTPSGQAACAPSCIQAAWRGTPLAGGTALNWDGDGCTDDQELTNPTPAGCGDDPWNPYDATGVSPDVSGPWDILATALRADCASSCGTSSRVITPGLYYNCIADVQQSGTSLAGSTAFCYIDGATLVNNKPAAGSAACPPADKKFCSDGLPGAPAPGCAQGDQSPSVTCQPLPANPPSRHDCAGSGTSPDPNVPCDVSQWQLAHVDKSASLTGTITAGVIDLTGCFPDPHGHQTLGAVYIHATVNAYSGHGTVDAFLAQPDPACATSPSGSPSTYVIDMVRQPPGPKANGSRDSDSDGCYDKRELQNANGSQTLGGLRDPFNPFDYPDMPTGSNLHKIRIDDVTYVINRYRHDMNTLPAPSPAYDPLADHTIIPGSNAGEAWHLGPPNGQIRIDDVTAVINAYRHDCA